MPRPPAISASLPDYDRPPALRFQFMGMNTASPPDAQSPGKYPYAANVRGYLQDAIIPRPPQSPSLIPAPVPAPVHSLRRMDDTTPASIPTTPLGPNGCSVGTTTIDPSLEHWVNPGNITLDDGSFASVAMPTFALSDLLSATGFGFAPPPTLHITGVVVEVKGFQSDPLGTISIQLQIGGVGIGTAKSGILLPPANNYIALGSPLDLWNLPSLTVAQAADASLGVLIQCSAGPTPIGFNVDFVRITLYGFTSSSPQPGFVLISGAADKVNVDSTQVASGMSGRRLSLVPFRPNNSVAPWMYVGDAAKMVKVRSDGTTYQTGIKEPQLVPGLVSSGAGPITGSIFYAFKYRSSATGAASNPSPTAHNNPFVAAGNNIQVSCTPSTDPQVDLIDVYRFGDLLDYTYVTTIQNSAPSFIDNFSAPSIAANPVMSRDDFEPFPSIDLPRKGTVTIGAGPLIGTVSLAQNTGDPFNVRWLGGTIINVSSPGATQASSLILFNRPSDSSHAIAQVQPVGTTLAPGVYNYSIPQPILAAQPMPALWGPTDNAAFMFGCGDPLRPGTLYFTKGNNPDSAPDTNAMEVTSPAEPLIGGCIVSGLGLVMSAERGWLIYPNFAQATATVLGLVGSPFSTVESITNRGLYCKEGICTDGGGTVYFIGKDGINKSAGGAGSTSITDADLHNLFPQDAGPQIPYTIAGFTVSPPDYSQPDGMALRFSQGFLYFDYIGLDSARHTLVYDISLSAWSVDQYLSPALIHADNTGAFVSPGPSNPLGPLMGCVDGTVRELGTGGYTEPGVNMTILTPAFDGGEQRAEKHFGDLYLETTTPAGVVNNFALFLYTNRYATLQPAGVMSTGTIPNTSGVRIGSVVELGIPDPVSGVRAGVYARDIGLSITLPVNATGSVLHFWQPSMIVQPETTGARVSDWYDAGGGAQFVQGVVIEADTFNLPKKFAVQSADDLTVVSLSEVGAGVTFNGRSKKAFSIAVPFVAHSYRLVPLDTVPWRVWGVQFVTVPYPELCKEWHTEMVSHGLEGWQHIGEIAIAHLSTADLTLTLIPDTGTQVQVVIPHSSGRQAKTILSVPAFKFLMVSYHVASSVPFRLWKPDLEVRVGKWGRADKYTLVKPFGGESQLQAEV